MDKVADIMACSDTYSGLSNLTNKWFPFLEFTVVNLGATVIVFLSNKNTMTPWCIYNGMYALVFSFPFKRMLFPLLKFLEASLFDLFFVIACCLNLPFA